jgi:F-type H+-transporting ATPase subunit delta
MGDAAVAGRYAEALYGLAREAGRQDAVLADLAGLKAALDAEPRAWGVLLDPRASVGTKERELALGFLAGRDDLVGRALGVIIRHRRAPLLKQFFRVYLEVHERGEGILRIQVETARALSPGEAAGLRDRFSAATGREVVLENRAVPALLGGMRVIADSRLIDDSLKGRLERVGRKLKGVPLDEASRR